MPKPFLLCFEAHSPDGRVAAIKWDGDWHTVKRVETWNVPMVTTYIADPHAQAIARANNEPIFYLSGLGEVRIQNDIATVTAT